ncbi:hypothetical protein WEI85_00365 [Actinomycetes bacterium KLBMP 9797]
MTTLSRPSLGVLIDAAGEYAFAPAELGGMLVRCGLDTYGYGSRRGDMIEMLSSALLGAQERAAAGDPRAHDGLLKFVELFIEKTLHTPDSRWLNDLRECLLADGYQMVRNPDDPGRYDLVPTDAGAVPLAVEISALERHLQARNYTVALNHYQQAINAFRQHNFEAANSQLRTALEDIIVQLAVKHTGFVKPSGQGGGGPAIDRLKGTERLADRDGGDLLKGLWSMSHTNGSHPGRSNADETRFRVHVMTATARLLLYRFP